MASLTANIGPEFETGLVWLRRDLRVADNAALYHALRRCRQVHCAFVFDTDILDPLPRRDRRVEFIRVSLESVNEALRTHTPGGHGGLIVRHGPAATEIVALARALGAQAVFAARDYEPAAVRRDDAVHADLASYGAALHLVKDHTIFEQQELLTQGGKPYTVFTPYKNAWLRKVDDFYLKAYPVERHFSALADRPADCRAPVPSLQALGFEPVDLADMPAEPGMAAADAAFSAFFDRIDDYGTARDYPAVDGTSRLSVHLRFGTISIRHLAATAHRLALHGNAGASVWLSELVWRDFYFQVLANYPQVGEGRSFKPAYDAIRWDADDQAEALFAAWCEGRTGYPLVDAAMAQINRTGYMHNRLRMVTACFLCKDLGIDWRRGEAYFAEKLNDFDLSANNGGWQWASSSGCDAQPYFRVFNPVTQSEKFDRQGHFIRRYLPQLAGLPDPLIHAPWKASAAALADAGVVLGTDYPRPVVDHALARDRTLERYGVVKKAA